MAHISLKVHL